MTLSEQIRNCKTLSELDRLIHTIYNPDLSACRRKKSSSVVLIGNHKVEPRLAVVFRFLAVTRYAFEKSSDPIKDLADWTAHLEREVKRGRHEILPLDSKRDAFRFRAPAPR